MRRKPANSGTRGRKVAGRRDAALLAVPTVRADEATPATPVDKSEQETEAESAVRRMVEAAYT